MIIAALYSYALGARLFVVNELLYDMCFLLLTLLFCKATLSAHTHYKNSLGSPANAHALIHSPLARAHTHKSSDTHPVHWRLLLTFYATHNAFCACTYSFPLLLLRASLRSFSRVKTPTFRAINQRFFLCNFLHDLCTRIVCVAINWNLNKRQYATTKNTLTESSLEVCKFNRQFLSQINRNDLEVNTFYSSCFTNNAG